MKNIRVCKIALVLAVALFFSVAVYNNITDHDNSWRFIQQVMTMATIRQDPDIMWRAISDPAVQFWAYLVIVGAQGLIALLCWVGGLRLLLTLFASDVDFNKAKNIAILGVTLGFLFYAVGFLIIAGEWFALWQSRSWNGQITIVSLLFFFGAVLVILMMKDEILVEDIYGLNR